MLTMTEITVDQAEARAKVEEYRAAVRERRSQEDARIARAFAVAARGKRILLLTDTLRAGGVDEKGRPRLAVCRADATRCELTIRRDQVLYRDARDTTLPSYRLTAPVGERHVAVAWPAAAETARELQAAPSQWDWRARWEAMVPVTPPSLRPSRRHRLHGAAPDPLASCHVLWEAEWHPTRAPRDPALLRHIEGDLWEVIATWDLTELERAVITGTRRA